MSIEKNINITRFLLYLINFLNVILFSFIVYRGNQLICNGGKAREFLEGLSYLPLESTKLIIINLTLIIILFITIYIRGKYWKENKFVINIFSLLDITICSFSIILTNFSYKGIILIAVINLIFYSESILIKYLYLSFSLFIYILLDYDIISAKLSIVSINEYISYFNSNSKLYIYSLRSILNSLNQVLFIGFMSFTLQKQIKEKQQIKLLYAVLIKTTSELSVANIQLELYAKKSEEMAKIKERNRLAREIHDTIGHTLTGIVTGLDACASIIDLDISTTKKQIIKISELARKGLIDVRRSVKALRPDSLERFTLIPAITKMAKDMNDCSNLNITLDISGEFKNIHSDEEDAIFRTVQEGITNSIKHGEISGITISLQNIDEIVYLEIEDNGKGTDEIHEGFGLKHIKERFQMLAGEVEFCSAPNSGFLIKAKLPLRKK